MQPIPAHPALEQRLRAPTPVLDPRRLRSDELFRGERRLVIEHGERAYTLLLTRNDKLILVK